MSLFGLIEYNDASPEVRAVYDDIMATRKTDWILHSLPHRLCTQQRHDGGAVQGIDVHCGHGK